MTLILSPALTISKGVISTSRGLLESTSDMYEYHRSDFATLNAGSKIPVSAHSAFFDYLASTRLSMSFPSPTLSTWRSRTKALCSHAPVRPNSHIVCRLSRLDIRKDQETTGQQDGQFSLVVMFCIGRSLTPLDDWPRLANSAASA